MHHEIATNEIAEFVLCEIGSLGGCIKVWVRSALKNHILLIYRAVYHYGYIVLQFKYSKNLGFTQPAVMV